MADLSSYTPIYIRTTGNDTTGNGSLGTPFATAQKGFDTAIATASGNYVLDFGVGSFGGVVLTANWPSRIAVRGVGATQSFLGGIVGNGANDVTDWDNFVQISPATNGFNVSIASDFSINVGNITANGGYADFGNGGDGGNITITDGTTGDITTNGDYGYGIPGAGNGGDGGYVTITGSTAGNITANGGLGGTDFGGLGGTITLVDSTAGNITANGGVAPWGAVDGGLGGTITLVNSTAGNIAANGGDGVVGYYNIGGNVTITNSATADINLLGGSSNNGYGPGTRDTNGPSGTATFAGTSFNDDTVTGNAVFNGQSFNIGTVTGTITYNGFTGTNQYGRFVLGQLARTLYFNGAADTDWSTLGNWWTDSGFTTQATTLPTSADDVIATANIESNSGSAPTVANFTLSGPQSFVSYPRLEITITVTGIATFYIGCLGGTATGTVNGNCIFNDYAVNLGTVNGDAAFNHYESAILATGTVNGRATFNSYSINFGTVNGNATFNDSSYNNSTINGNATFNDSAHQDGTVNGNAMFKDYSINHSYVTGDATFNNSAGNFGSVDGNARFNDNSATTTVVFGNADFYGNAINAGYVIGDATFNDSAVNSVWGFVIGNATFNDSSFGDPGRTYSSQVLGPRTQYPIPRGLNGTDILGMI